MRKYLILSIFVLLSWANNARAAFDCSMQVYNSPGDIVTGVFHIIFGNTSQGISWENTVNGRVFNIFGPQQTALSPGHPFFTINFVPQDFNAYIQTIQLSGPTGGGWGCWIEIDGVNGPRVVDDTFKQKSHAAAVTEGQWAIYLGTLGALYCPAGGPVVCAGVYTGAGWFGLQSLIDSLVDPWDPNFYDLPEFVQYDLSAYGLAQVDEDGTGLAYYINDWLQNLQEADAYARYAESATDKLTSCRMAVQGCDTDPNNRFYQYWYAKWGYSQMGQRYQNISNDLWVIAWYYENIYGFDPDGNLVSTIRQAAQNAWDLGAGYQH